jgi:hypothetical protein
MTEMLWAAYFPVFYSRWQKLPFDAVSTNCQETPKIERPYGYFTSR